MGFTNGAYATVWEVRQRSAGLTSVRLSISRKSRETGDYEQKFSGYVAFAGSAVASRAAKLKPRDRIKLVRTDVENPWDPVAKKEYMNFYVYEFEDVNDGERHGAQPSYSDPTPLSVDDGEITEDTDLPF